jgi:prepilin-type N-terminal cleavage/methylation domain-containing protein
MNRTTNSYNSMRKRGVRQGFSLVELSLSLMILAVILVIFGSSVLMAERSAGVRQSPGMNGQYTQAMSICQHKMDQLRAKGFGSLTYTELSDAQYIDDTPTSSTFKFNDVDHVGDYLINPTTYLKIETWSGDSTNNTILVTISITWYNLASESKQSTVTIQGYITNVGDY